MKKNKAEESLGALFFLSLSLESSNPLARSARPLASRALSLVARKNNRPPNYYSASHTAHPLPLSDSLHRLPSGASTLPFSGDQSPRPIFTATLPSTVAA